MGLSSLLAKVSDYPGCCQDGEFDLAVFQRYRYCSRTPTLTEEALVCFWQRSAIFHFFFSVSTERWKDERDDVLIFHEVKLEFRPYSPHIMSYLFVLNKHFIFFSVTEARSRSKTIGVSIATALEPRHASDCCCCYS